MHPFYLSLNAVLEKEESSITKRDEVLLCETIPNILPDALESISPQTRRWGEMLKKIRNHLFSKQVAFIIVYYYMTTIEHNSEISPFSILKQMLQNQFIDEPIYTHIIGLFQKAQRCYHGFSRLARIFRLKKTQVQITSDLYMTELHPSNRSTFVLLDTNRIYYFSLKDLARILTEALTFSYSFFSEPNICKNPYNNVPFTKSTLYNIYFQMKSVFCVVPPFIQLFFEADFDVYKFKKDNEWTIRKHKIREYIDKTDSKVLMPDILRMFHKYDTEKRLSIHKDVPSDIFVNKVKPLYHLYLKRKYCFCQVRSEYYENELSYKMKEFIRLNPKFGRKFHFTQRYFYREPTRFHTELIDDTIEDQFMTSHQYNDAIYNRFVQYGILSEPTLYAEDPAIQEDPTIQEDPVDEDADQEPRQRSVMYHTDDEEENNDTEDEDETPVIQDEDDIFHDIESETESDTDTEDE